MALQLALAASVWLASTLLCDAAVCTPYGCSPATPIASRPVVSESIAGSAVAPPAGSDAVVRIIHRGTAGSSVGSGAIIAHTGDRSFVLTCAHLFDGGATTQVMTRRGTVAGTLVAIDRVHDLALIRTQRIAIAPLRATAAVLSGQLTTCGFGGEGRLRCVRGSVLGSAIAAGASAPSTLIAGSVRPGDSGGPVLDGSGRVVAVIWGERAGRTYVMGGGPLGRILRRLPRGDTRPPPPPAEGDDRRLARIEQRLDAMAEAASEDPDRITPSDMDRLGEQLARSIAALERRMGRLAETVKGEPPSAVRVAGTAAANAGKRWERIGAIALSIGGPAAVGWFAWRAWRRASKQRLSDRSTTPIAVDTPPPPQRVKPETHYVSYERDDFAKAHQWASEQLARKFPGSVELLTSLDSLIRQQLASVDRTD